MTCEKRGSSAIQPAGFTHAQESHRHQHTYKTHI
jgi:hypothetical protein